MILYVQYHKAVECDGGYHFTRATNEFSQQEIPWPRAYLFTA